MHPATRSLFHGDRPHVPHKVSWNCRHSTVMVSDREAAHACACLFGGYYDPVKHVHGRSIIKQLAG